MDNNEYFHIPREKLEKRSTFPFQLFVFDPANKTYSLFLSANSPMTKETKSKLESLLNNGSTLAILERQRLTFQRTLKIKKDDPIYKAPSATPSKSAATTIPIKKEIVKSVDQLNQLAKDELSKSFANNNFIILYEKAQKEIENFSLTVSQMNSLAVYLSGKFLSEDSKIARIMVISYFLARSMNISNESKLSAIVCGAFFSQIGMISMALRMNRIDKEDYDQEDKENFEKYPSLSLQLCRKAKIDMSEEFQSIVLDHQEKLSGRGFPSAKSGAEVCDESLIVGIACHIIEENNKELPIGEFISQNKETLVLEFGEKIVNNFLELLETKTFKQAA